MRPRMETVIRNPSGEEIALEQFLAVIAFADKMIETLRSECKRCELLMTFCGNRNGKRC